MSQKYYTILTEKGAALLANATALGVPLKLSQMAVGDGNGTMPNPIASQTKLVNEVRRAAINTISIDENNPNQIIAEQVIPEDEGGWFIHEIGLFDDKDNLIAVGNCPATYKPKLSEGSGRTQVIRMIIIVDNVDSVAIKIDPSVVLATREYVEKSLSSHNTTAKQDFDSEIKKLVPHTRKINNKELKSDINLLADDINALPAVKTITNGQPIYEVGAFVVFKAFIGDHRLFPFRASELPPGWYVRNGDNYPLSSPQGVVLNSLSDNYKRDYQITIKTIGGQKYINVPSAFASDGRGLFERPVNGTTRQVGTVQNDAIRNIYGEIIFHGRLAEGSYPALANGVFSGIDKLNAYRHGVLSTDHPSFGGFAFNAENFVPTGPENVVINEGKTPAIYLGV